MPVHFHMCGPFSASGGVYARSISGHRAAVAGKAVRGHFPFPGEAGNRRVCRKRLRDEADTRTYRADAGYSEAVVRPVSGPRAPAGEAESRKSGCKFAKTAGIFYF